MEIFHSINILSTLNNRLTTVLHSFYLLSMDINPEDNSENIKVLSSQPPLRKGVDFVQDAVKSLIYDSIKDSENKDYIVRNVITNHDGRLYLFARIFNYHAIVCVSTLPLFEFFRGILNDFNLIKSEEILPNIYALCELPIVPIPNFRYDFELSPNKIHSIQFNKLEHVLNRDMTRVILNFFTPYMIVKAWEALILERRVLVCSNNVDVLMPACEFLSKLITPFDFNGIYIPVLPESGLEILEAPGKFLIGAKTQLIQNFQTILSGILVIDLDQRIIIHTPTTPDDPYLSAPPSLLKKLFHEISDIKDSSISQWYSRPTDEFDYHEKLPQEYPPDQYYGSDTQSDLLADIYENILRIFNRTNLTILSAQYCILKAFFRLKYYENYLLGPFEKDSNIDLEFSIMHNIHCGCVHLWKDSNTIESSPMNLTIPVWLELDNSAFAVYVQAHDIPYILIPLGEIETVANSTKVPEGCYAFELTLKNQTSTFRFQTYVEDSKQNWINILEKKMANYPSLKNSCISTVEQMQSLEPFLVLKQGMVNDTNPPNQPIGLNPSSLGIKEQLYIDESEVDLYNDFRYTVRQTQLVLSLYNQTECETFNSLFTNRNESLYKLLVDNHSYYERISKSILTQHRVTDILNIMKMEEESFSRSSPKNTNSLFLSKDDESTPFDSPISLQFEPKSQSQVSSRTLSAAESNEEKPRRGILSKIFRRNVSSTESNPSNLNLVDEDSIQKQQILEKIITVQKSYNRCLSEINSKVTDDIYNVLSNFLSEDNINDPKISTMKIQVFKIIKNLNSAHKKVLDKCHELITNTLSDGSWKEILGYTLKNNEESSLIKLFEKILYSLSCPMLLKWKGNKDSDLNTSSTVDVVNNCLLSSSMTIPSELAILSLNENIKNDNSSQFELSENTIRSSFFSSNETLEDLKEDVNDDLKQSTIADDLSNSLHDYSFLSPSQPNPSDSIRYYQKLHTETMSLANQYFIEYAKSFKISSTDSTESDNEDEEIKEKEISKELLEIKKFQPIVHTLLAYSYKNVHNYWQALKHYSKYSIAGESRLSFCLLQAFISLSTTENFAKNFSERGFILCANQIRSTLGVHAYRLILELAYTELINSAGGPLTEIDSRLTLGSFRYFPRFESRLFSLGKNQNPFKMGNLKIALDFEWTSNTKRNPEVFNEVVICTKINSNILPHVLSHELLLKLREIIKSYAKSSAGAPFCKKEANGNILRLKITPQVLAGIRQLSAFKKFECESSQLQQLNINNLKTKERIVFFVNIYNMLMIHSIIIKGTPGTNILERTSSMRTSKYNIGGILYSLIDIEHGILRNASTKPMLLGPLSFDMSFSSNDPRKKLALDVPVPNITFALYSASYSSPPLHVLKEPSQVEYDLFDFAKIYLNQYVKFDPILKGIFLPSLIKVYWADFGKDQNEVLKYISSTGGERFKQDAKEFLTVISDGNVKPSVKTHFLSFDWTPVFTLINN